MLGISLFGVGSPLIVDYEETCRRLGWEIRVAVKNVEAHVYCSQDVTTKEIDELTDDDLSTSFLAPLFTPRNRKFAVEQALDLGFAESPPLVDPTAIIAESSQLGVGSYANAGCIVGAQGVFGRHVILNRGSSIGHHARIDDFVSVGPGAIVTGQVSIGAGSVVGAGAVLLPQVTIGSNTVIGAGTIVYKDIGDDLVVKADRNLVSRQDKENDLGNG